jgi:hypothetical protein
VFSCHSVAFGSLREILLDTFAILIHLPQGILRIGVALRGCFSEPPERFVKVKLGWPQVFAAAALRFLMTFMAGSFFPSGDYKGVRTMSVQFPACAEKTTLNVWHKT